MPDVGGDVTCCRPLRPPVAQVRDRPLVLRPSSCFRVLVVVFKAAAARAPAIRQQALQLLQLPLGQSLARRLAREQAARLLLLLPTGQAGDGAEAPCPQSCRGAVGARGARSVHTVHTVHIPKVTSKW